MPSALLPSLEQLSLSTSFTLPPELLLRVLAQLDNAIHLYTASLVSKAWRAAATDSRLWEDHYWRFYRPIPPSDEGHNAAIYRAWEQRRYAAMMEWLRQASPSSLATPPFLEIMRSNLRISNAVQAPDFHVLFVKQMNADEELLRDLRTHVNETSHVLRSLLRIVNKHGSTSRYLLATLCATQRLTDNNIERLLPPDNDANSTPWPRALQLHLTAGEGRTPLHSEHSLALHHAANMLLGHLQRRDGILSIQSIKNRKQSFESSGSSSLREKIERCCLGVEEASESVTLFRGATRSDVRDYLDLLALFVFSDLEVQDRCNKAGKTATPLHHSTESCPSGSTRRYMARIVASLRWLGFTTATGPDLEDLDNAFLNVVLHCPAQRPATPLTLATIVCLVARRLGITATLTKDPSRSFVVVVEDGDQPATWGLGEDDREWQRFVVSVTDSEERTVWEVGRLKRFLTTQGVASSQQDALLEPASPLDILDRIVTTLKDTVVQGPRAAVTRRQGTERYVGEDDAIIRAEARHAFGRLRLYLQGRQPYPPSPLMPTMLPPSLVMLPSTHVHGARAKPNRLSVEAMYCIHWIVRILASHRIGGVQRANDTLGLIIATPVDAFGCDYVLLAQLNEGTLSVETCGRNASSMEQAARRCSSHFASLLDDDARRGSGLGCAGDAQRVLAERSGYPFLPRHLFDRAHHFNRCVQFGVGAVVRNRKEDWYGVVIGWDREVGNDEEAVEIFTGVSSRCGQHEVELSTDALLPTPSLRTF